MTEKQFKLFVGNNYGIQSADGEVIIDSIISVGDAEVLCDLLNEQNIELQYLQDRFLKEMDMKRVENEQLKSVLKIYRKVANCRNCYYHDYDTLFGGYDDYEICNKGNDVSDGICSEWREH